MLKDEEYCYACDCYNAKGKRLKTYSMLISAQNENHAREEFLKYKLPKSVAKVDIRRVLFLPWPEGTTIYQALSAWLSS